jgi:hypothetical protein
MSKKQQAGKAGVLALGTTLVGAGATGLSNGEYYGGLGLVLAGMGLLGGYELVQDKQIQGYADMFATTVEPQELIDSVSMKSTEAGERIEREIEGHSDD